MWSSSGAAGAPVSGRGDHACFALLEEGCRFVNCQGARTVGLRLEEETRPHIKGTLIENFPKVYEL